MRCSEDKKAHCEGYRKHKFLGGHRVDLCITKNVDDSLRLLSEKREE